MKYIKWILGTILFIFIAGWIVVQILSEKRPPVNPTPEADRLADQVMDEIGKEAFDSLPMISWYLGDHEYLWNKKTNQAMISWGKMKVMMNLDQVDGIAFKGGEKMDADEDDHCIKQAWEYWCNDSFWAFAPFKMKDPGTTRTIVSNPKNGEQGLMVSYESGGVTPGDSYLWILDKNNQIIGFQLWVKILPIKGAYASWNDWKNYNGGIKLADTRKLSIVTIPISGFKIGESFKDFGYSEDPFKEI
jgi:hypothetical protein